MPRAPAPSRRCATSGEGWEHHACETQEFWSEMKAIDQFMWGYQPHLRMDIEHAAEQAFESIDVVVAPVALLIGFREEDGDGHAICIEPETLGVPQEVFAGCIAEGDAAYDAHEFRGMLITDQGQRDRYHTSLRDRCRAAAIERALSSCPGLDARRWFVGRSAVVAGYRVYPAVGMLRTRWEALPSLVRREGDHRTEMFLSLQESVAIELLRSASFALSISEEPQALLRNDRDELVGRATRSFLDLLVYFKGEMGSDLGSAMSSVAAQPYEGRTGVGTMIMARDSEYRLELAFERPIRLTRTRALRKALEMTDPDLNLVTDGSVALGLGRLREDYEADSEVAFRLRVTGRGRWELEHAGVRLLEVADGHARVPRQRLHHSTFADVVGRLFGDDGDVDRLWDLARAASRQAHGTMLVVHGNAQEEAIRLSPPAMGTKPKLLDESTLLAVSAIDGAIIVDPRGRCHAIGAILDGRAAPGVGDASRGARFNSAHRYLAEAGRQCLIIIVSEDGMINLIPELPRRVKRSYVEDVVSEVEVLSRRDPVDFEAFHKREEHLRALAFYLTAEQCDRANASRERVEQYRASSFKPRGGLGGITRVGYSQLVPDPRLDDTYFLEEDGP